MQGLCVERALTGDHELCLSEGVVEPGELEDDLHTWPQRSAQQRDSGEPDPACRARTRMVTMVLACQTRDHVGPVAERLVEDDDLLRISPLLRTVDSGGSGRPGQRVVDIASQTESRVGESWM